MGLTMTRRKALISAGAFALAACTPAATTPGASATGSAAPKALAPFKWLFGFTLSAGSTLPIALAHDLHYYEAQGLDVAWDYVTDATGIRLVATGQYQAGSASDSGTTIGYINQGIPLKVVAMLTQRGSRALAVKKGSPIKRPKDFEGKKVGIKGIAWTEYLAMLAGDKVDRSKVQEIPVGFSSVELKDGIVDVLPVFRSTEPWTLANTLNTPVDLIVPEDFGFTPLGTGIVVSAAYAKSNPDQVTGFLKAVLKAAEYYQANRSESIQTAVQYGGPATPLGQHQFLYDATISEMQFGQGKSKGVGFFTKDDWQKQIDALYDLKVITAKPKVDDVVDTSFVEKVLNNGKVVWP
jgi:putative hydroxymethylpyrimidine transport system substrate-binding protein